MRPLQNPRSGRAGSAGAQVLLGIALIAGLIGLTIPVSRHELRQIQRHDCIVALAWIAAAKAEIAQRAGLKDGDPIDEKDLGKATHLESDRPPFPQGVQVRINPVGKLPTCEFNGETLNPLSDYARYQTGETV
jgi:hypothetical protein